MPGPRDRILVSPFHLHAFLAISGMCLRIADMHIARTADTFDESDVVTGDITAQRVMRLSRFACADSEAVSAATPAVEHTIGVHDLGTCGSPPPSTAAFPRLAHSAPTLRAISRSSESSEMRARFELS